MKISASAWGEDGPSGSKQTTVGGVLQAQPGDAAAVGGRRRQVPRQAARPPQAGVSDLLGGPGGCHSGPPLRPGARSDAGWAPIAGCAGLLGSSATSCGLQGALQPAGPVGGSADTSGGDSRLLAETCANKRDRNAEAFGTVGSFGGLPPLWVPRRRHGGATRASAAATKPVRRHLLAAKRLRIDSLHSSGMDGSWCIAWQVGWGLCRRELLAVRGNCARGAPFGKDGLRVDAAWRVCEVGTLKFSIAV